MYRPLVLYMPVKLIKAVPRIQDYVGIAGLDQYRGGIAGIRIVPPVRTEEYSFYGADLLL
jgi:hypothetical protein